MPLLICRTCPRYDPRATGDFGRALNAAIADHPQGGTLLIRNVACLGGCPDHGAVAVDGPGKTRVRFTGLGPRHAEAVIQAAVAYEASPSGAPADWPIPAELARHISSVTSKRAVAGIVPPS